MKKKSDIRFIQNDNKSLYYTLVICLIVFITAISILVFAFNRLISDHDQYLSGEMCTLLSEKVNNSIDSMTESTRSISMTLSAQRFDNPSSVYNRLKNYRKFDFMSIGFIDENGVIYASKEEIAEFEKWELSEIAKTANPVSISVPYRSSIYGQYVITIFSEVEYGDFQKGYLFTTYLFKTLQDIVATKTLVNDIEIMLINAESANIINCVGVDKQAAGSWTNAYLSLQSINENDRQVYIDWLNRMFNGEGDIGLSYKIGDVRYSQYCTPLSSMLGWYISVKIPDRALSTTMHTFRNYVLAFTLVLLVIVFILIMNLYRLSERQAKVLEHLSIFDPLTGAFNRRAFDIAAENMLKKCKKCALIFFDIDYFKQVNDTFGHDSGDKLLKDFAGILNETFVDNSIVSRFGGDEFVVLTEFDSSDDVNSKLKDVAIATTKINLGDFEKVESFPELHFSAGAAGFPADAEELSALKKCADLALYKVKENGRNGFDWYK